MNTRSIRFQLLVWYAALLVAAFAMFGLFMYAAVGTYMRQSLRETLSRRARQIARTIELEKTVTPDLLQAEIESIYAPQTSDRFFRVTLGGTNVLYQSGMPNDRSFDPAAISPSIPRGRAGQAREFARVDHLEGRTDILLDVVPLEKDKQLYLVEVGRSLSGIRKALWKMVECLLIGVPTLIAIAGTGAYVLIGRALRPAVRIARSAEQISLQNLDAQLPIARTGDELETLSIALDGMLKRLREAYDYTRRFLADASHELRTPLAVLRGELEHLVGHTHLGLETRETLGSNLEEVERLGKIVEGLFALSRLDAGEAHAESVRLDLAALAATTTEQMCLLAEDKNISLKCESGGPVFVEGDQARLKQVIVNLVDNAIKYTGQNGVVSVRTFSRGGTAILEVKDNGIGIPAEALPHIFERFYRVDKARSRDLGGAGLGLSIVRSICHAHSGAVEVESADGRGSTFRVKLPRPEGSK